jgi:prepilin-type N-terminal cleavage/methylation domain-containing protein
MKLTNIKLRQKDHGFTIVELLVVIVVIGILAAITIISYAGITARANTSSAQSAANAFIQKAEAYNADVGVYPPAYNTLTSASSDKIYALTGVTVSTTLVTSASSNSTVNYFKCPDATPVGIGVAYFDYSSGGGVRYIWSGSTGNATSTGVGTSGCVIRAT